MKTPTHLYHYTNIEAFELILKNQNIKFNRLDKVDDLNEGMASDRGKLGMYVFVSCWTDHPMIRKRSIHMMRLKRKMENVFFLLTACMEYDQDRNCLFISDKGVRPPGGALVWRGFCFGG
jgi:hypothetical protein